MIRGRPFNSFSYRFIKILVFKSVATRIPDSTRLVDPSRSPVYSDVFNYLLKTFCLVLLNFRFQKCRDPNPRLDPVGESMPEPGLLRHFQLSSQNILFVLSHFRLFNYAEALHFGQAHKHLHSTKCIYKIMLLYNVYVMYKILVQILFSNHFLSFFTFQFCDFTYGYRVNIHDRFNW